MMSNPFSRNISESQCPCEKELYDVRVSVDPKKSPNTRAMALKVYNDVYTSASTFMKKQGMLLTNWANESHSVIPEEPCYRGFVEGGEYEVEEGAGPVAIADIAFRLEVGLMNVLRAFYISHSFSV